MASLLERANEIVQAEGVSFPEVQQRRENLPKYFPDVEPVVTSKPYENKIMYELRGVEAQNIDLLDVEVDLKLPQHNRTSRLMAELIKGANGQLGNINYPEAAKANRGTPYSYTLGGIAAGLEKWEGQIKEVAKPAIALAWVQEDYVRINAERDRPQENRFVSNIAGAKSLEEVVDRKAGIEELGDVQGPLTIAGLMRMQMIEQLMKTGYEPDEVKIIANAFDSVITDEILASMAKRTGKLTKFSTQPPEILDDLREISHNIRNPDRKVLDRFSKAKVTPGTLRGVEAAEQALETRIDGAYNRLVERVVDKLKASKTTLPKISAVLPFEDEE